MRNLCLILLLLVLPPPWAHADDTPLPAPLQAALQTQLEALPQKLAELERRDQITSVMLEQAELDAKNARLQVQNLRVELSSAQRESEEKTAGLAALTQQVEALRKEPVPAGQEQLAEERLTAMGMALEQVRIQKQQAEEQLQQAQRRYFEARMASVLADDWLKRVQPIYRRNQSQTLDSQAQIEQQRYLDQAEGLRRQLEKFTGATRAEDLWQRRLLEARVFDAEERAVIVLRAAKLAEAETQLQRTNALLEDHSRDDITPQSISGADKLAQEMSATAALLKQKIALLEKRLSVLVQRGVEADLPRQAHKLNKDEQELVEGLLQLRREQLTRAQSLEESARNSSKALAMVHEENQRRALYARRDLPLTPDGWQALLKDVAAVPEVFWQQLQSTLRTAGADLRQVTPGKWLTAMMLILLLYGVLRWGRRHLQKRLQYLLEARQTEAGYKDSFFTHSVSMLLRLAVRNIGGLLFALILLVLVWVIQPAASTAFLILAVAALWLAIKLPVNFAWLLLAAPSVPEIHVNPQLYRQLRWMLILFGTFATLTLLVHLMPFPQAVRELNDTFFMLFLLLAVVPALHIRKLGLERLQAKLPDSPRWLWVLRLLSLLLPLSILAVSLLGVLGFLNLGWAVARQLSWLLLVLTIWLVLRGLLKDLVMFLKNVAMQHSPRYGLLWTQDIIPILQRLAQLLLAVAALLLLLRLNGWDTGSTFGKILAYSLFSVGDSTVTLGNFGLSVFAFYAVFWLGGWVKQITYRWIYSGINDLGVRHSLSTFTQYAVLIVGGIIALRILGVDLTTLTVFAGALGVGLGFGLQNIANNFVSGLLLLAERPLRTGDLVNVGGSYEGEVKEIGVRSLTIKTWDYQEVIVPNSELISSPFTNWTHSDNILRTVLFIGVSYDSDLKQVKKILEEIVRGNEHILKDPEPAVLLSEFADSAVTFRVHYFGNLREYSLITLKSDVLMEIWDRFKAAGVEIPFPQRDIHIRSMPGGALDGLTGTALL